MTKSIRSIAAIAACALALIAVADLPPLASADQAVPQRQKQPEAYQERLVQWILEDPQGFFHPSIVWRRLGLDGKSGPYAMHAAADIPAGTPLIVLPRKYVLQSGEKRFDNDIRLEEDPRWCITVEKMLNEHFGHRKSANEKTESFYAPYLSYLFEEFTGGTTRGLLPTSWSEHSKQILDLILGEDEDGKVILSPADFEYNSIFEICTEEAMECYKEYLFEHLEKARSEWNADDDGYYSKEEAEYSEANTPKETKTEASGPTQRDAEDAYIFLLSRGWDDKLLPVVDMFNHRNGPWRNVEITPIDDEERNDVAAYAWRDISQGEQLQYTYSECMDATCQFGGLKYAYSTQSIFAEYGFTELYPQRWVLFIEEDEDEDEELAQDLHIEVTSDFHDETKLIFKWIYESPNETSIRWIGEQLDRLKSIKSRVLEGIDALGSVLLGEGRTTTIHNIDHERDAILEFYNAYIRVFELALEHKYDPVAVTMESFYEDLEEQRENRVYNIDEIRTHELLTARTVTASNGTSASMPSGDEF